MDELFSFSCPAYEVVVIGASLGGVQALAMILSTLPPDFPTPIVVVQHISPNYPSCLHEVLGWHTHLRVQQAGEGEALQPGTVYTPVPDHHLIITSERTFTRTQPEGAVFAASHRCAVSLCCRHVRATRFRGGADRSQRGWLRRNAGREAGGRKHDCPG